MIKTPGQYRCQIHGDYDYNGVWGGITNPPCPLCNSTTIATSFTQPYTVNIQQSNKTPLDLLVRIYASLEALEDPLAEELLEYIKGNYE